MSKRYSQRDPAAALTGPEIVPITQGGADKRTSPAEIRDYVAKFAGLSRTAVKTAAYAAAPGEIVPVDTTAGPVTITLPTAPADRSRVAIKHIIQGATNTVTYQCGGADVLNKAGGATSGTLPLLAQSVVLEYSTTGAIWTVISADTPLSQLDARYIAKLASGLWATISALTPADGTQARVTDIGANGSIWVYNATDARWRPLNGSLTIVSTGIPMVLPSSGTIGNNGALTLSTALPATYANAYMYFPANAIVAGSTAGLYYVQMSSPTAGTIFNNTYTAGLPAIPAVPTPFVTVGPGAYTQTTGADIALLTNTVPGGVMGLHGSLFVWCTGQHNNSAGNKTYRAFYGGASFAASAQTTSVGIRLLRQLTNRGVANAQVGQNAGNVGSTSATNAYTTVNTAVDQTFVHTGNIAVATDYVVHESVQLILVTP